jgi:hypothetical protein
MGDLYLGFICVFIVSINQSTDELEKNKNEENLEGNISLGKGMADNHQQNYNEICS